MAFPPPPPDFIRVEDRALRDLQPAQQLLGTLWVFVEWLAYAAATALQVGWGARGGAGAVSTGPARTDTQASPTRRAEPHSPACCGAQPLADGSVCASCACPTPPAQDTRLRLGLLIATAVSGGVLVGGLVSGALGLRKVVPHTLELAMLVVFAVQLGVSYRSDATAREVRAEGAEAAGRSGREEQQAHPGPDAHGGLAGRDAADPSRPRPPCAAPALPPSCAPPASPLPPPPAGVALLPLHHALGAGGRHGPLAAAGVAHGRAVNAGGAAWRDVASGKWLSPSQGCSGGECCHVRSLRGREDEGLRGGSVGTR